MKDKTNKDKAISLQKWAQIHESKDPARFVLYGKNKEIQTEKQVLKKFHKLYSQIY